ncbi:sugar phosphate nucleotidyltransferase [Virgibacillus sp. LDC1]|uniref:sugar phosphate nucleotidyltransferase n=1 Tax=Paenibacillus TaxID=44249 RepID=UPI000C26E14C|nr:MULTISPECIES: sugar phosphate nucleotidyltransferase [Paenibacillus]MCV4233788.1 sugar phosphate nucleotidyltransferase [Virgibacillus sp. LDC1]MEC0309241.1 sugar phosphate nucleotidyltransferase [Paenibacillus lautus]PJN51390.1 Mannose-1-phosphate guanylyltransferase RfbM [Paenibacillus sp. GM2FR]
MKLVLLSGGSGKRLWPLSNDARSKQFLKVLENDNNELVSMVQRVWGQIKGNGLVESCYIATSSSQIEIMRSQIGNDIPLIVEPERRDTFAAIMLASTFLYSHATVGLDEVIVILPVDPYVENHFFESIKQLEEVLNCSNADIALIGVQPTYPSTKYGYIIPTRTDEHNERSLNDTYMSVSHFQEKPTEAMAERLIDQNALWNCGVFAFRLGYVIELLERKGLPIQFEELSKQYNKLPKISFDYEVLENASELVVLPYEGYWKDLGTWNTLTEEMQNHQIGKGIISEDCSNTHLINEIDIPVSILGLSNIVVAISPDGILVSDKSASPRLKDFINFDQGPMYEERQWGSIRILDDNQYEDGRCVTTKRVSIQKGKNLSYRMHTSREEVWTIVKGKGEFIQNGNFMEVSVGNVLHNPVKTLHSIRALSELEIIVVQSGVKQEENQVVELYHTWDEIARHCIKV